MVLGQLVKSRHISPTPLHYRLYLVDIPSKSEVDVLLGSLFDENIAPVPGPYARTRAPPLPRLGCEPPTSTPAGAFDKITQIDVPESTGDAESWRILQSFLTLGTFGDEQGQLHPTRPVIVMGLFFKKCTYFLSPPLPVSPGGERTLAPRTLAPIMCPLLQFARYFQPRYFLVQTLLKLFLEATSVDLHLSV